MAVSGDQIVYLIALLGSLCVIIFVFISRKGYSKEQSISRRLQYEGFNRCVLFSMHE